MYGYFIGEQLALPIVEAYVKNAWAKYGFEHAIFRNGFFFFKFSSHDGIVKTLDGGPWFIRSMPIFLNVWSINTKLKREEITKVPVWVKIHKVPMVAFSKTRLSLITTQLGRPIMLDACTSDMCINPWGRNSYAQVLVELSSECDVLETIIVAIPLPKGEGNYLETLDVEYEWWPPRCSKCKIFDHEDEVCPSRVKKICSDTLSRESGLRDAGIQHKKKGTNKAAKSKQGFRFSKPNLIYRPVSKPSTFIENTSMPNSNAPPISKEVVKGADIEPNLRSNIEKLMDEDKVLELNTNNVTDGVVDTMNSAPNLKNESTNTKSVLGEAKGSEKGSLWEQFSMTHAVSTSQPKSSMSYTDESDEDEVYMPDVLPGGGFLDDLEGNLDCYNGYEAQVYDIAEKEQAFCDQYHIRLNRCCRK
ncbi:zinc knuckle CX2CX4HX4C containing protein [Tanacetum coccineum]